MKGNVKNIVLLVACVCVVGVGIGSIFMFGFNNGNLLPDVPSNNPDTSHVLIDDGTGMQTEYQDSNSTNKAAFTYLDVNESAHSPITPSTRDVNILVVPVNFDLNDIRPYERRSYIDFNDGDYLEAMEYTFNAKADLSTPLATYSIKAWATHPDDIDHPNDTCYTSVKHKAPLNVPYTMGFEASENTEDFKFYNLNNDEGTWDVVIESGFYNMARTGNGCLSYGYDSNNDGNDWAMLDPINVEPGYYVLKFWYSNLQSYPEKLAVYWGNEATPEAMTNKIVEYAPFSVDVYSESVNIIHFDKAQTIYLGFYAFSEKNQNLILIDDVSFDKIESETGDLALSDLQNVPDFVRESSSKDVKFNIGNGGISEVNAKINVSIDDVVVKESEAVARPQVLTEITINDVLVDLSDGNHTLKVEVVNDNEGIADNNVLTKDFTVVSKPAKFWNFEDGQLPAEFTFRAEDGGTVSPAAGEEFHEDGWGLFNIVEHEVFGEYLLAGTSWLNGTDQADRWLILPQVSIDGPDSYFVWDGYSYNKTYLEDYQIMVSESDDNTASFTELLTVEDESIEPKTRGISLADYAGKDI